MERKEKLMKLAEVGGVVWVRCEAYYSTKILICEFEHSHIIQTLECEKVNRK